MSESDQPELPLNEAQQRINNILLSNSFLLISATGEVVCQNVSMEGIWPLLESVKFSLLSQLVNYCIDQRLNALHQNATQTPAAGT